MKEKVYKQRDILNVGKVINYFLACILIGTFFSCNRDYIDSQNKGVVVPEGKVRLHLNVNSGDYTLPSSRATANEYTISDDIWVAVFEGTQISNAVYTEVAKAEITGEGIFVTLSKSTNPSYIVVIANTPTQYYNAVTTALENFNISNLSSVLSGKTLVDLEDILLTQLLPTPVVTSVPYIGQAIPMAALAEATTGIGTTTDISNNSDGKLYMTRLVAKVDVTSTAPDFELIGATVINAPYSGTFFRATSTLYNCGSNLTDYLATGSSDEVAGISAAEWDASVSEFTTSMNPIYVYESPKANNTAVIIEANYKGNTYYYNLGFVDESGDYMDIIRNKHYKFKITSITAPGTTSFDLAKEAPSANINYKIDVIDDFSHDIISNGKYYLGVSNSELIIYGDEALTNIIAFSAITDASTSSGVSQNIISVTGTGLTLVTPGNNGSINLASSPTSTGTTDVHISVTSAFTTGSIKIQLGDMTKEVTVTRKSPLNYSGVQAVEGEYVSGVITQRGTGQEWLFLSTDGSTAVNDEIKLGSPGTIFMMAPSNISTSGGNPRTGAEFFLSRNNDEGRVKFLVSQGYLNIGDVKVNPIGYIGAFWKASQTGERLIRIPHQTGTEGGWTAMVIEGSDWIKIDTEESKDPNIGWKSGSNENNVADMNDTSNDAAYQVSGNLTSASGMLVQNGYIYFRIGLKSTYTPTTANPVRYGVILLSYNENSKFSKIYIRQGEDGDYLMRPTDSYSQGSTRNYAKMISAYNIMAVDQHEKTGGTGLYQDYAQIDRSSGVFTDYPTQVGGYLQHANSSYQRISYNAINPVGAEKMWSTSYVTGFWMSQDTYSGIYYDHETCPKDWRRPHDGKSYAHENGTSIVSTSEIRQSLFLNPQNGTTMNNDNVLYGYYADGFFDRRKIVSSLTGTPSAAVSVENGHIAYIGYLFYNPNTNASVFFPLSGNRGNSNGALQLTGEYGAYWTGSSYSDSNQWVLAMDLNGVYSSNIIKSQAVSVRCVKK